MKRLSNMLSAACLALMIAGCAAPQVADRGRSDYQKLSAWNAAYESQINTMQNRLQEKMKRRNKAELATEMLALTAQAKQMLKSLDALDIQDRQIVVYRDKLRETLTLSGLVLIQSAETMAYLEDSTTEVLRAKTDEVRRNAEKLQQVSAELRLLSAHLEKVYGQE